MPPVGQNAAPGKTGASARSKTRPPKASAANSFRKLIPRSRAAITSEGVATPGYKQLRCERGGSQLQCHARADEEPRSYSASLRDIGGALNGPGADDQLRQLSGDRSDGRRSCGSSERHFDQLQTAVEEGSRERQRIRLVLDRQDRDHRNAAEQMMHTLSP
jgi:hypothetical protein